MASRTPQRRTNNPSQTADSQHQQRLQATDYESDNQNYFSDAPNFQPVEGPEPGLPLRSNEELNLTVLRRHNPSITAILSLAPYAVVYIFSSTTRQWEKSGIEGTMFVCQLQQGSLGEERYSVFVLNRRGLNNFDTALTDANNVEITDEYVILKVDGLNRPTPAAVDPGSSNNVTESPTRHQRKTSAGVDALIYGLWIYSEPPPNSTAETRTLNAQVIRECAAHAGQSLKLAKERVEAMKQDGLHAAAVTAAPMAAPPFEQEDGYGLEAVQMGRRFSLKDLFGQQRAQDDAWSVKAHNLGYPSSQQQQQDVPQSGGQEAEGKQDLLADLFRRAGLAH